MNVILVFCTFPSLEQARQIGTTLVNSQHAACVNLIPTVESIYRWKGAVETSQEVLAIFKTTPQNYPNLETRLKELHPYEVPEILALEPTQVSAPYARWVNEELLQINEPDARPASSRSAPE
jgi:periplasmic divalent cation tolerance protein